MNGSRNTQTSEKELDQKPKLMCCSGSMDPLHWKSTVRRGGAPPRRTRQSLQHNSFGIHFQFPPSVPLKLPHQETQSLQLSSNLNFPPSTAHRQPCVPSCTSVVGTSWFGLPHEALHLCHFMNGSRNTQTSEKELDQKTKLMCCSGSMDPLHWMSTVRQGGAPPRRTR